MTKIPDKVIKKINALEALVNIYGDQPENLVNKIWAWHKQTLKQNTLETLEELMDNFGTEFLGYHSDGLYPTGLRTEEVSAFLEHALEQKKSKLKEVFSK